MLISRLAHCLLAQSWLPKRRFEKWSAGRASACAGFTISILFFLLATKGPPTRVAAFLSLSDISEHVRRPVLVVVALRGLNTTSGDATLCVQSLLAQSYASYRVIIVYNSHKQSSHLEALVQSMSHFALVMSRTVVDDTTTATVALNASHPREIIVSMRDTCILSSSNDIRNAIRNLGKRVQSLWGCMTVLNSREVGSHTLLPHTNVMSIKVTQMAPSQIRLITTVYDGRKNLPLILRKLNDIGISHGCRLHLFVWNNGPTSKYEGTLLSTAVVTVSVHNSAKNEYSWGRHMLAQQLARKFPDLRYVIHFDDDQIPTYEFLLNAVQSAMPHTMSCWYVKTFAGANYWKPLVTRATLLRLDSYPLPVHYCGPGASVIDARIYSHEEVMIIPEMFKAHDDLWLNYWLTLYKWNLRWLPAHPELLDDEKTQRTALHRRNPWFKSTLFRLLFLPGNPLS